MAQVGLVTPGLPEKNFTQDVLNNMQKQGTSGIGKVFVGPQNITTPQPIDLTAKPLAEQYIQPTTGYDIAKKITDVAVGVGKFGYEMIKPSVKNLYNFVTFPAEKTINSVKQLEFAATHGGQMKDAYYSTQYQNVVNDFKTKQNQLINDLKSGTISKSEYDAQLTGLTNEYTPKINDANSQKQQAYNEIHGWRDWQTGQYKSKISPGDVWNIVDAGITAATLGTAGAAKGAILKTAEEGLVGKGGTFLLKSLENLGLEKSAAKLVGVAETSSANKVVSAIDNIISSVIERVPAFRVYAEKQIAKAGGDITAQTFFKNALVETLVNSPLRNQNMVMAKDIVDSIRNSEFAKTPEGKTWLSSGIGQSVLIASMAFEGGPFGIFNLLGKAGRELKLAAFGDAAINTFKDVAPEILSKMDNAQVIEHLQKIATNEQAGTNVDHFLRLISGKADNAMEGYKVLAQNREMIPYFRAFVASKLGSDIGFELGQAAAAGILKDMFAKYTSKGLDWGAKEALDHVVNYAKMSEVGAKITENLIAKGKIPAGMMGNIVAFSRQDQADVVKTASNLIKKVVDEARVVGDVPKDIILLAQKDAVINYIADAQKSGVYWAQHDGVMQSIVDGVKNADRGFSGKAGKGNSIINAIKNVDTAEAYKSLGLPKKLVNELKAGGYVYSLPDKLTNPWITVADAANTPIESLLLGEVQRGKANILGIGKKVDVNIAKDLLASDVAAVRGANPAFGRVGNMLNQLGLSPNESGKEAYRLINTNATNQIDSIQIGGRGLPKDGSTILNDLYKYIENPEGSLLRQKITGSITDLRMMTVNEIQKATGLSAMAAKEVQKAIIQAHIDVPVAIRGLGDKVVDYAQKNPLQRAYQRVQGTLRYTWNPFFRTQEIVETKALAAGLSNGMTLFNPISAKQADAVVNLMENYRLLEGTRFGEAATNVAMGKITASLSKYQKRDLARYVQFMADKMTNGNVEELLASHTTDVIDAIRPIVQYPTKGILNSNLARTMNLVAFPARYNVKVAGLAVKILSQQSPMVQAAVVRGLADFSDWLKTPDGLAWRQDYANEIAMMKWLTPVGNLDWTMKALTGNFNSWRDVGMLGGLPFGLWSQILTSQGVLPEQPPYVDPSTGAIYSRKIPESTKGRMAMAIMDMLSSTFTYPGRTLMLPSKSGITKNIAYKLTGAKYQDISTKKYTPAELNAKSRLEQQFWYNRANTSNVSTQPSDVQRFISTNLQSPQVTTTLDQKTLQQFTKAQIRQASKTTTKGKKKKAPVPFQQIVGK